MKAVILAAGEGTRMKPLTSARPKPMLPVGSRPLLAHTIDAAVTAGADEIILVVGYKAEQIRSYFGEQHRGISLRYAFQEDRVGTAHAVKVASEHISGPFVVLNGDNLYDPVAIEQLFSDVPAVCAYEVSEPQRYGVLSTENGAVTDIVEKPTDPPTNLANCGAYSFPVDAIEWLDVPRSKRDEYELTDVLTTMIREYAVSPIRMGRWVDVGRPWDLLEANEWKLYELEKRVDGDVDDTAILTGEVVVEAGASVRSGVVVEGPVLIRSGATVGPNAYVRGPTLIGESASVGHAVEIKHSVLSTESSVSHLSYVGDSILGRNVNFGAGTTVANLRHDEADVRCTINGTRISTNRRKFGVVAGDGVKTGINTSLTPGLRLRNGATTRPGETVTRDR